MFSLLIWAAVGGPSVSVEFDDEIGRWARDALLLSCSSVFEEPVFDETRDRSEAHEQRLSCTEGGNTTTGYRVEVHARESPEALRSSVDIVVQATGETPGTWHRELEFPTAHLDEEAWVSSGLVVAAMVNAAEQSRPSDAKAPPRPIALRPPPRIEPSAPVVALELGVLGRTVSDVESFAVGGMLGAFFNAGGSLRPGLALRLSGSDAPTRHLSYAGALGVDWVLSRSALSLALRADVRFEMTRFSASVNGVSDAEITKQWGGALGLVASAPWGSDFAWVVGAQAVALFPPVSVSVDSRERSAGAPVGGEVVLGLRAHL
jgi:hypothetical protein